MQAVHGGGHSWNDCGDTNRPGLQQLLAEVAPGDVVLVYKLDRLTRSIGDLDGLLKRSQAEGWHLRSVTESLDTTSATGRAMVALIGVFAQWERETIAERVRMGRLEKARSGRRLGSPDPLGYRVTDGMPEIDPETATIARDIYRWYLHEHLGISQICARLNGADIPSPRGKRWRPGRIHDVLANPLYCGDHAYDGQVLQRDVFPALVERADWDRVQLRLTRSASWRRQYDRIPARARSSRYLLTGILKCALCGSAMVGIQSGAARQDGGKRWMYACTGYLGGRTCRQNGVRVERCDEAVVDALRHLAESGETNGVRILQDSASAQRDLQLARDALAALDRRRQRAWQAYMDGDASRELWRDTQQQLARERERLKAEVARLEAEAQAGTVSVERGRQLADSFATAMLADDATLQTRKGWLQEHVREIRVRGERMYPADLEITLL